MRSPPDSDLPEEHFEADLDCDGSISISDQLTMLAKIRTYEQPGPSGLVCAGTSPAPERGARSWRSESRG